MTDLDRHTWLSTEGQTDALNALCKRLGCNKAQVTRIALKRLAAELKIAFPDDVQPHGTGRKGVKSGDNKQA